MNIKFLFCSYNIPTENISYQNIQKAKDFKRILIFVMQSKKIILYGHFFWINGRNHLWSRSSNSVIRDVISVYLHFRDHLQEAEKMFDLETFGLSSCANAAARCAAETFKTLWWLGRNVVVSDRFIVGHFIVSSGRQRLLFWNAHPVF